MHYVSVASLAKSFGVNPLFRDISFNINEGDKIALIARNGIGKSTLLKILFGNESPDEGKVWINKEVTVALFEQDPKFIEEQTILENIFHTDHPVLNIIKEYESASDNEDIKALSAALIKMDEANAWNFEAKVKEILGKLDIHHLQQKVGDLSGGRRKRVALAKTLIDIGFEHQHTLLLMDEPTNHLDIEMVEWLEHYLKQENVTLLLVSHDRYFLDAVCDAIWEMDRENIYTYPGNYQQYMELKAARLENEQAGIDKAKNSYRRELEWMRKQPKARTTKSKSRIDAFYDVEKRAKKKIEDAKLQLQVKMSRLGGKIAEMKKVYKSYGERPILQGFDYTFNKGDRIGIIGKNGAGKSTFLKVLQQIEKADSGKINIGDTVIFGNFSQEGLVIKENMRLIEYVKSFAENFPLANGGSLSAAQFLELFLFPPEKQYTYLNSLSGGEKKRVQLLTILFRNPNFLILDEPTNDLDLPTLSVLENFLSDYPGCVIIVSHDRYFMDRLVDHLFIFEGDGVITDFPGNYTLYRALEKDKAEDENYGKQQKNKNSENNTEVANATSQSINAKIQTLNTKRKLSFKEKTEFNQLEKEMPALEEERKKLTERMSNGNLPYTELSSISERVIAIENELSFKEMRWLELSEDM